MASHYYPFRLGLVHYTRHGVPGSGRPVLLVHGLYPGASLEEFEHNVAALAHNRDVYALDLLGFGLSAAPRARYTAGLYTELIAYFIHDVIRARASVIAAGQSAAFAAQIAAWKPALVDRLVLLSPPTDPVKPSRLSWLRTLLVSMAGATGYYEVVTSAYGISDYLQSCFADHRHVTPHLIDRLTLNASRRGSERAYFSWIAGQLDTDLRRPLTLNTRPTLLLRGDHAPPLSLGLLPPTLRTTTIDHAGSWLHDERARTVNTLLDQFLSDPHPLAPDRTLAAG